MRAHNFRITMARFWRRQLDAFKTLNGIDKDLVIIHNHGPRYERRNDMDANQRTQTPAVPSHFRGSPVVAVVKRRLSESVFPHRWVAVTEESDGVYAIHEIIWTGAYVPRTGSVTRSVLDYGDAVRAMVEEAGR